MPWRSEVNPFSLLFFGLFWSPAPAECPPSVPVIAVEAKVPGSTVDRTRPRSEIARMMKTAPYEGFAMQGLTVLDFSSSFRLQVSLSEIGPGRWCASADRIEASFGLSGPARILVASEIEPRSCRYRTVLAHERQHVQVGERNAREGAEAMRSALEAVVAEAFPVEASTRDEAYATARGIVEETVSTISSEYVRRAERENMAMDTIESYRRLSSLCP